MPHFNLPNHSTHHAHDSLWPLVILEKCRKPRKKKNYLCILNLLAINRSYLFKKYYCHNVHNIVTMLLWCLISCINNLASLFPKPQTTYKSSLHSDKGLALNYNCLFHLLHWQCCFYYLFQYLY